jgi:hypothetical protein
MVNVKMHTDSFKSLRHYNIEYAKEFLTVIGRPSDNVTVNMW